MGGAAGFAAILRQDGGVGLDLRALGAHASPNDSDYALKC